MIAGALPKLIALALRMGLLVSPAWAEVAFCCRARCWTGGHACNLLDSAVGGCAHASAAANAYCCTSKPVCIYNHLLAGPCEHCCARSPAPVVPPSPDQRMDLNFKPLVAANPLAIPPLDGDAVLALDIRNLCGPSWTVAGDGPSRQ